MSSSPLPLPPPPAWSHRLADQLQLLCELTENLTFRLLEAEERLAAQDRQLRPLLEGGAEADPALAAELDLRLGDTEERLARIEAVLNGLASPGEARHLQAVQSRPQCQAPPQGLGLAGAEPLEPEAEDQDPFLDEEEQTFMDELIA